MKTQTVLFDPNEIGIISDELSRELNKVNLSRKYRNLCNRICEHGENELHLTGDELIILRYIFDIKQRDYNRIHTPNYRASLNTIFNKINSTYRMN